MLRFRRIFASFLVALTLLFAVQRANAFWDEYGTFAPAIAAAGAGAGGLIATGTGVFLGFTPVGWAAIGLVVVASALMTSDSSGVKHVAVVSTRAAADDPNPDLATAAPTAISSTVYAPLFNNVSYPYLYVAQSAVGSTGADYTRFSSRLVSQLAALGYSAVLKSTEGGPGVWAWYGFTDSSCPAGGCIYIQTVQDVPGAAYAHNSGTCPSGIVCRLITSGTLTTPGMTALYIPLRTAPGIDCPAGSAFDYVAGACLTTPPANEFLADGVCRITWAPNGCPMKNPFDPDCAAMTISTSCGTTTTPPFVKVTDPETGKIMTTSRPATAAQGTVGAVTVQQDTPDSRTNTTVRTTTTTAAPATPGAAPATIGGGQVTVAGTGATAGTTPLSQVSITNWPSSFSVSGTVSCSNCTTAAPSVTFPDSIKISEDGLSDVPVSDAVAASDDVSSRDFLASAKEKILPFSTMNLNVASNGCPVFPLQFNAWNFHVNYNDNSMCDFLESSAVKSTLSFIMNLLFLVASIFIVMGA